MKTHSLNTALAFFSALILTPLVFAETTQEGIPAVSSGLSPRLAGVESETPTAPDAPSPELIERADKIVAKLNLSAPGQTERIRDLVARQYVSLAVVHGARDEALKVAKSASDGEAAAQAARDRAASGQADLHYAFLAHLSAELAPAQVDQIKDGMTYGVLPNTFQVYREMLPDLTPEQSTRILAWLTEAREHAMDAGSSKEKHAWFGKFKGRINNYLSKAGYDMKKAEREMFARKNLETKSKN